LCGAFYVTLDDEGFVETARIAFGGMAGTPKRAKATETALIGRPWAWGDDRGGPDVMSEDYQPLSDWRASAEYRMLSAQKPFDPVFPRNLRRAGAHYTPSRNGGGLTMDAHPARSKTEIAGGAHSPRQHDSAHKHVTGSADYIDDMPEPAGALHGYLGLTDRAHARMTSLDLDAVRQAPGVVAVLTGADVPGVNDISPTGRADEPVLATDEVLFHGQPVFAVIAETRDQARRAAKLAVIAYDDLPHVTDVRVAMEADYPLVTDPLKLERGDVETGLAAAPLRLTGDMRIGGQDHFYLEGHIALAEPGEDREMVTVWSSTQHPSEVQHMVAHVLDAGAHDIEVKVRRMGGGFGGKETQSNQIAVIAALFARRNGCAVKLRLDRDEDMVATGKRHDFDVSYQVGY
jgi:xanthine dehydrogenase large subunit